MLPNRFRDVLFAQLTSLALLKGVTVSIEDFLKNGDVSLKSLIKPAWPG